MVKDWLIKKLGGLTKSEHLDEIESQREKHEKWAVEFLTGKSGEVTPDVSHYFPFHGDDIVIVRSRVSVSNAEIRGIKVAPWCRNVIASNLRIIE